MGGLIFCVYLYSFICEVGAVVSWIISRGPFIFITLSCHLSIHSTDIDSIPSVCQAPAGLVESAENTPADKANGDITLEELKI